MSFMNAEEEDEALPFDPSDSTKRQLRKMAPTSFAASQQINFATGSQAMHQNYLFGPNATTAHSPDRHRNNFMGLVPEASAAVSPRHAVSKTQGYESFSPVKKRVGNFHLQRNMTQQESTNDLIAHSSGVHHQQSSSSVKQHVISNGAEASGD